MTSIKKEKLIFIIVMAALLLLQTGILFYYGNRKAGFHEDELYTFYSTNKTAGLFVNDRQWMEKDAFRNDFVVLPGEGFRYDVVKQMQSWDVHPPLYYYMIHTVCSFFSGVFSKWLGIGVNLIGFILSFVLLAYVCYTSVTWKDAGLRRRGEILAFLTCLGWGSSAAVISGVMFIRMYQWLTFFVLLCLGLHLRAAGKQEFKMGSFFVPLSVTVFLGFLTQYYYIIFHFFLGAGFCLLLLKWKRFRELAAYVIACAVGLLGAIIYYPASVSHIFRGYRGTEAVSEFSDISNTWGRLRFFGGLFDDYVMNGTLSWWLLILLLLIVTAEYERKRGKGKLGFGNGAVGLMAFACAGYFFTVSKTALLLGETSNRYQLPVYGILLFLLFYGMWMFSGSLAVRGGKEKCGRVQMVMTGAFLLVILLTNGLALKNNRVFFLYEQEREVMEFARENQKADVAVFYNEASGDHIWWLSDELMEYDRIYLASRGNREPITDDRIRESNRLLVYVADYGDENKEECLEKIMEVNDKLKSYEVVAEKGLWTLYLIE